MTLITPGIRIRVAVARAESHFPQGAGRAFVDDRQVEAQTVVLAVGGSDDIMELQLAAERLKNRLYSISADFAGPAVWRLR